MCSALFIPTAYGTIYSYCALHRAQAHVTRVARKGGHAEPSLSETYSVCVQSLVSWGDSCIH